MKILVYCPINPARRFADAEASILALEGAAQVHFDFFDDPAVPWHVNIVEKYRAARRVCLDGGYDAMLTAESDMLIPPDALSKLAALDTDIAYGLYVWRHGAALWNAYVAVDEESGFSLSDVLVRERAPVEWAAAHAGKPFRVYGAGMGCTLIKRRVLEQIDFRRNPGAQTYWSDWLFILDAERAGFVQLCDPTLVCGHISDSGVLYPDLTHPELYRTVCCDKETNGGITPEFNAGVKVPQEV